MAVVNLDAALIAYETTLERLEAGPTPSEALAALLARDGVAAQIAGQAPLDSAIQRERTETPPSLDVAIQREHTGTPPAEALQRLTELDGRLIALAPALAGQIEPATLAAWREARQPPADAWWWRLDERAAAAAPQPSIAWPILAGLLVAVSISLTADISRRFLSAGSDFIGSFSTISQAILALVASSTFLGFGRQQAESLLQRLGVPTRAYHYWKAGLALLVLALVLGLRLSLPAVARFYNNQGVHLQTAGSATRAIESYQRAISLNPDYAQAHYNLATAYEDVLEYDKALVEYQTAIRADPLLHLAYNNLARLYILRRLDYASALALLNAAQSSRLDVMQQPAVQYSILKNLGWAHLGLKLYGLAEANLRQALELRPDGATAHCLLAQVLEGRGASTEALPEWEACLGFAGGDTVEPSWLAFAQDRLSQGGSHP